MISRSLNEAVADVFDTDLFRLIERAHRHAEKKSPHAAHWSNVARALRAARPAVRVMMNQADREEKA